MYRFVENFMIKKNIGDPRGSLSLLLDISCFIFWNLAFYSPLLWKACLVVVYLWIYSVNHPSFRESKLFSIIKIQYC